MKLLSRLLSIVALLLRGRPAHRPAPMSESSRNPRRHRCRWCGAVADFSYTYPVQVADEGEFEDGTPIVWVNYGSACQRREWWCRACATSEVARLEQAGETERAAALRAALEERDRT